MESKQVPHEHWCTVCKRPEGCEDKFCQRTLWDVCERPECQKIYKAATVHRYTDTQILPCCGLSVFHTPGDRMTTDPTRVTCKGPKREQLIETRAEEVPVSLPPGHVPGCLCTLCAPVLAAAQTPQFGHPDQSPGPRRMNATWEPPQQNEPGDVS